MNAGTCKQSSTNLASFSRRASIVVVVVVMVVVVVLVVVVVVWASAVW